MSSGSDEYWRAKRQARNQRKSSNMEILEIIKQFLADNPDQRFCQAMVNLGLGGCTERYHYESVDTLKDVRDIIDRQKEKARS